MAALFHNTKPGPLEQADIPVQDQADIEFQQLDPGAAGKTLDRGNVGRIGRQDMESVLLDG